MRSFFKLNIQTIGLKKVGKGYFILLILSVMLLQASSLSVQLVIPQNSVGENDELAGVQVGGHFLVLSDLNTIIDNAIIKGALGR